MSSSLIVWNCDKNPKTKALLELMQSRLEEIWDESEKID